MIPLVDTHCHLGFESYDDDREEVLARAREAGVRHCVVVAVDGPSARRARQLARAHPGELVATAGLHPNEPDVAREQAWEEIAGLLDEGGFVALGETGLDLYRDTVPRAAQEASLRRHLDLALERELPVVLHCRDAFGPLSEVLASYRGAPLRGVLHCFTGGPDDLPALHEAGLHVGFGGITTFGNAGLVREAARQVPGERLLLETDAPFLAPAPRRGQRNEPAFVVHTAVFLAELRGVPAAELGALTSANARALFGLQEPADG
jgi:TatD DNase family protein